MWRVWAKALGQKDGRNDREADIVAWIRTIILLLYMVTNAAIIANAVRHWNDNEHICNRSRPMEVRSSSS